MEEAVTPFWAATLMPKIEICAIHGVGLETTDLPAARERGVVTKTAPVLFDDVADVAVALALACCRQIPRDDRIVREGGWGPTRVPPGRKLTGMRVGIVGLGRIGIELARRLEGFQTTICYFDPAPRDVHYRRHPDALTLAGNSDVLFLCAAGGPKGSPPIIGGEILEALGPRGIFVEKALIAAPVAKAPRSFGPNHRPPDDDRPQQFKRPGSAQKFLAIHAVVYNTFNVQRHLTSGQTHRMLRAAVMSTWREAVTAA
jgi:D-isomer specific 2-hydroxyacid dehydrogenase, NAD binding domain